MHEPAKLPTVVLICHKQDRLDAEGLAAWLASSMRLVGLVVIADRPGRVWTAARNEWRRSGLRGLADALLFRLYARAFLRRRDEAWKARALARLRGTYAADVSAVPRISVTTPNSNDSRAFLAGLGPDLIIARCKHLLKPSIFELARVGSFALHPGFCPEYRNAHGCFWALARRDLERVGMTLLRIDNGIDTGPIYLQATTPLDEVRNSHVVIQYQVVLDNLDSIARTLAAICRGEAPDPVPTAGRRSAVWGHPRMSTYLKWKWMARRSQGDARRTAVVS